MSELKACPFCGSENIYAKKCLDSAFVRCTRCSCDGPFIGNEEENIDAWNRRTEPNEALTVVLCKYCVGWKQYGDSDMGECYYGGDKKGNHFCAYGLRGHKPEGDEK